MLVGEFSSNFFFFLNRYPVLIFLLTREVIFLSGIRLSSTYFLLLFHISSANAQGSKQIKLQADPGASVKI